MCFVDVVVVVVCCVSSCVAVCGCVLLLLCVDSLLLFVYSLRVLCFLVRCIAGVRVVLFLPMFRMCCLLSFCLQSLHLL